jgi:hypothetical protein
MGVLVSAELSGDQRLQDCSVDDAKHVTPGSQGPFVRKIQDALISVGGQQIAQGEVQASFYGESTTAAVLAYKGPPRNILNYKNEFDPIVGKKTIRQLDKELKAKVPPKPQPRPEPPPILAAAGVNIGPIGPLRRFVDSYYRQCRLETIGPAQLNTGRTESYTTFEGLLDLLIARKEQHQIILNHGNRVNGLLIPMAAGSNRRETGMFVGFLSELADEEERGRLNANGFGVQNGAAIMGVAPAVVVRLVKKLVRLRARRPMLHFRACTVGVNQGMVRDYKRAFGAVGITCHTSRLLYLHIKPKAFDRAHNLESAAEFISGKVERLRVLDDPIGLLGPLILNVQAVEHDPSVGVHSFLKDPSPGQVGGWAEFLVRQWDPVPTPEFIVPVMWQTDDETTFFTPLEPGWREKLVFI